MAEKEYIEREAAIVYAPLPKHLREYQTMNLDDAWEDGYDFAISQIESIPAADVRPVVFCRDCTHCRKGKASLECKKHTYAWNNLSRWVNEDDFCSWGVKMEES